MSPNTPGDKKHVSVTATTVVSTDWHGLEDWAIQDLNQ
jgi:hypothetical protein